MLTECGHVPQVELPERANGLIREQVESAEVAVAPAEPGSAPPPSRCRERATSAASHSSASH